MNKYFCEISSFFEEFTFKKKTNKFNFLYFLAAIQQYKLVLFITDVTVASSLPVNSTHHQTLPSRRYSTGSIRVMNSHVSPLNLQSPGQTVVVSHHRGFSQPSSANTGDPWFLQSSHQMAPTAPARQHKRPAPQPGSTTQQQQQQQQSIHLLPPIPQSQLPSHPANTVIAAT